MNLLLRILEVNHDRAMKASVTPCLQAAGHRVPDVTTHGTQGTEVIGKENPALVVLDVTIPNLIGLEVTSELRRQYD